MVAFTYSNSANLSVPQILLFVGAPCASRCASRDHQGGAQYHRALEETTIGTCLTRNTSDSLVAQHTQNTALGQKRPYQPRPCYVRLIPNCGRISKAEERSRCANTRRQHNLQTKARRALAARNAAAGHGHNRRMAHRYSNMSGSVCTSRS